MDMFHHGHARMLEEIVARLKSYQPEALMTCTVP
jgi:glycerol-3-phosphate cytidylyltransferase-like family protein